MEYFQTEGNQFTEETFSVSNNGAYTVYAKDKAGNEKIKVINVTKIDRENLIVTVLSNDNAKNKSGDILEITGKTNRAVTQIDESKIKLEGNGKKQDTVETTIVDDETVLFKITCSNGNGDLNLKLEQGAFKDSSGNASRETIKKITELDNQGPTINEFKIINTSTNSIKVQISAEETQGVGLDEQNTFSYYISKNQNFESEEAIISNEATCEMQDLLQNTTYYLRAVVKDKLGNKTISTIIQGTTQSVPGGEDYVLGINKPYIEFSDVQWQDQKAGITITNNSNFNMQYKILNNENVVITNWTNATESTVNVNDMYNNYWVVARLADGENVENENYGSEASTLVFDTVYPSVLVMQQTGLTNSEVTVNTNFTENESGIEIQKWETGEILDESYFETGGNIFTGNSFKVNSNGRYTVYVKDRAGNETIETILVTNQDKSLPLITETKLNNNASKVIKNGMKSEIICIPNKPVENLDINHIKIEGAGATGSTLNARKNEADGSIIVEITAGSVSGNINLKFEEGAFSDNAGNPNTEQTFENIIAVDNDAPKINNVKIVGTTTGSITVQVEAQDVGSAGLSTEETYSFYISDSRTFKDPNQITEKNYFIFRNLKKDTQYYIKVIVKDALGNESESDIKDVRTESVSEGEITDQIITWSNEKATLSVDSDNGDLLIQYKIISDTGETKQDWAVLEKGASIENLYHKYKVILRLSDTTEIEGGNYSDEITVNILDETSPRIDVTEQNSFAKDKTRFTVTVTENESGIKVKKWAKGSLSKEYFRTGGTTFSENYFDVTENGTYTIYVSDKAGNETIKVVTATKFDKTGPEIEINVEKTQQNKIKITVVSAEDRGVGMPQTPTYKYYISESEDVKESDLKNTSTQTTYTYDKAEEGKTYYIYVSTEDKLQNTGKSEVKQFKLEKNQSIGPVSIVTKPLQLFYNNIKFIINDAIKINNML